MSIKIHTASGVTRRCDISVAGEIDAYEDHSIDATNRRMEHDARKLYGVLTAKLPQGTLRRLYALLVQNEAQRTALTITQHGPYYDDDAL